jgi:hypothetical protein
MSWNHRLATLEPSSSFVRVKPINSPTTTDTSRSSTFERRLAKYRSLPLLWLRTCGSSDQQVRRNSNAEHLDNNSILLSLGRFGECEYEYNRFIYICPCTDFHCLIVFLVIHFSLSSSDSYRKRNHFIHPSQKTTSEIKQ